MKVVSPITPRASICWPLDTNAAICFMYKSSTKGCSPSVWTVWGMDLAQFFRTSLWGILCPLAADERLLGFSLKSSEWSHGNCESSLRPSIQRKLKKISPGAPTDKELCSCLKLVAEVVAEDDVKISGGLPQQRTRSFTGRLLSIALTTYVSCRNSFTKWGNFNQSHVWKNV